MARKQTDPPIISIEQALAEANKAALEPKEQPQPAPLISMETILVIPLDELQQLTRRLLCQCGEAALMTEDEIAQAMLDTLAQTALKPIVLGLNMKADIDNRLKAIDKWLDRTKGKSVMRVDQRIATVEKKLIEIEFV